MKNLEDEKQQYLQELYSHGFERIASAIEAIWGSAECEKYLISLIIDFRGGRTGFPVDVFSPIIKLHRIHSDNFDYYPHRDIWTSFTSRRN